MKDLDFVETEVAAVAEPRGGRAAKIHMIVNIVLAVLATAAFFFVVLFSCSAIEAYIGMQDFDGEGFNGDGVGFALSFVLVLVSSVFSAPLSLACAISSGIAAKRRVGIPRKVSVITLVLALAYIVLNVAAVVAFVILGRT